MSPAHENYTVTCSHEWYCITFADGFHSGFPLEATAGTLPSRFHGVLPSVQELQAIRSNTSKCTAANLP